MQSPDNTTPSPLGDSPIPHDPRPVVGSLDSFDYIGLQSPAGSESNLSNLFTRSTLGMSSVSSPQAARRRSESSQNDLELLHDLRRKSDHHWTVFAQLMENGVQPLPNASTQQAPKQRFKPMTSCEDLGTSLPSTSLQGLREKLRTPFHTSGQRDGSPAMSPGSNPTSFVKAQSPATEQSESFRFGLEPPMTRSTDEVVTGYDSASDDSNTSTTTRPSVGGPTRFLNQLLKVSMAHRNVLKCSIAYLIASLFTFSPYLSGFISDLTSYGPGERKPSPSGHMVATM